MSISPDLRRLIDAAARHAELPTWRSVSGPELLEGLILTESGGDPRARRYEPAHDRVADGDEPAVDNGDTEDSASYGLMQVMGFNLRKLVGVADGVPMDFSWAYRPLANLAMGTRLFAAELHVAQVEAKQLAPNAAVDIALARYNGGHVSNGAAEYPRLRNNGYVERVYSNAQRAQGDRRAVAWKVAG